MANPNRRLLVLREDDFKDPHMFGDILDMVGEPYKEELEVWVEKAFFKEGENHEG